MKRRVKRYSATIKAKVVLEAIREKRTIAEIGSAYEIHPCNIKGWKRQFLSNIEVVFDREMRVKAYKEELASTQNKMDELYRQIGELTTQLSWAPKKNLRSLDLSTKRALAKKSKLISIQAQCDILGVSRSALYYQAKPEFSKTDLKILKRIDKLYAENAQYGYRKYYKQLKEEKYDIGVHRVRKYMKAVNLSVMLDSLLSLEKKRVGQTIAII
jgi:putative transposase